MAVHVWSASIYATSSSTRRGIGLSSNCVDVTDGLEILYVAAVVRTVSGLAVPSFLYTSPMMTADFGGPVTTLRLRVYQIGALGRGAANEALV